MEPDRLNHLLDRSAPPVGAEPDDVDIRIMMRRAKREAQRGTKGRKLRISVAVGLSAALLAGGGVAVAQSIGWSPDTWAPRYESPDASFPVTLPSGRQCDVRAIAVSAKNNDRQSADVNKTFQDWLKKTDLRAALNLPAAHAEDARLAAESPDQTVVLGPEGLLTDVPTPPSTRSPDDVYANVIQIALRNALMKEATKLSMDFDTSTFNAVIKCEPVAQ